jgi:hypothetical protein
VNKAKSLKLLQLNWVLVSFELALALHHGDLTEGRRVVRPPQLRHGSVRSIATVGS